MLHSFMPMLPTCLLFVINNVILLSGGGGESFLAETSVVLGRVCADMGQTKNNCT